MDEAQTKELQHKEVLYRQMTGLYPDEPRYRRRLIELLLNLGNEREALAQMKHLERLYIKQGKRKDADSLKLIRQSVIGGEDLNSTLNPFLSGIHPSALNILMRDARKLDLQEGDMLIKQGDTDDAIYLVIEGELATLAHYRSREKPVLIHILREGEIAGETAFLDGRARTASVVAHTRASVLKLSPRRVLQCMLDYPEVAEALRQESSFRSNMAAIHSNKLLSSLTREDKETLALQSAIEHYPPFTIVSRSQQSLDWVGIMVSGLIRVVAEDKVGNSHLLEPVKPGDLIGEMAALGDEQIHADMVAVDESAIMKIPVDTFTTMMEANQIIKKRIIDNAFNRIADTMIYIQKKKS